MIIALIAIILMLSVWYIYTYLTRHFNYWETRHVRGPKPIPVFGNIKDIAMLQLTQAECLQNIYKNYTKEKYIGMFQFGTPTVMLLEPQIIKQFLIKDFQHFTDRGFTYDDSKEPLTANLVNLEGTKWRILRQKLTPAFTSGKIKNMMNLLHECSEQLLVYLQEKMKENSATEIEMREFTAKFTTDVIGSCAFGLQFNSMREDSSDFRRMGHKVLQPSKTAAISKLIQLTDELIAAQAFVFFLAGFETSSTTLSFCMHELALNKSIQDEVYSEINDVIKKYGQPLCYESLKYLDLLERCLLETMRKYPPVQALARVCTKAYEIPNTSIRLDEGVAVLVPVYAIHHDERYYKEPEQFNPARFTKENISQRPFGTYMPFGDGPRICIGMRFAVLEMKLALATILYKYEIGPCSKTKDPLELDPTAFILAPKNGIWVQMKQRTNEKH